jgi:hypothetical protein
MFNDIETRFLDLVNECKRVNLITEDNRINTNFKKIYNKRLSEYYLTEIDYFLNNIFSNNIGRFRYHLRYNILSIPKCKYCDHDAKWDNYNRYLETCGSEECKQHQQHDQCIHRQDIMLSKYGVRNALQLDSVREKIKQICREKYGSDYYLQSELGREKVRKTNLERYGVEWHLQSEEIKDKIIKTNLARYGVENPFANKGVQEKIKQTNLEKYGTEYASQSEEVKDRIKQTNIKKYGVDSPLKSEIVKEHSRETCIKKYGVDNVRKSDYCKDKIRQTNFEKYGDTNFLRSNYFKENCLHSHRDYFYNNIYFDSSYEIVFYKYCIDKNIKIIREPRDIKLYYYIDNTKHYYYPDFKIILNNNEYLVEISSNYTWSTKSPEKKKLIEDNNILVILDDKINQCFDYCKEIGFNYLDYRINYHDDRK